MSSTATSGGRAAASGSADGSLPAPWSPTWPRTTFEQSFTISSLARIWLPERLRATRRGRSRRRGALRRGLRHPDRRRRRPRPATASPTGSARPRPASRPRTSRERAARFRATSAIASSSCPTGSAPACEPSRRRSPTASSPRPIRLAPCRITCATTSPTPSRCSAGTARTPWRTSSSRTRWATASSSPAPSRRWPARSACRLGSRSGSPPAMRTTTSRGSTTSAGSTPTPGPRCTSRARDGCSTSRRPVAAPRTPRATPAFPSNRRQPGSPRGTVTVPSTSTTAAFPSGRPPRPTPATRSELDASADLPSGEGTDSVPARYLGRPLARAAPVVVVLLLGYAIAFPLGLLLWRSRRRRRADTPLALVELAWIETVEDARLVGYEERASDTYFERAHHLATALPGAEDAAFVLARCPRGGHLLRRGGRRGRRPRRAGGRRTSCGSWPARRRRGSGGSGAGSTRARSSGCGAATTPPGSDASRSRRAVTSSRSESWSAAATGAERAAYSSSALRNRSRIRPRAPPIASRRPVARIERVTWSSPALPSLRRLRSK